MFAGKSAGIEEVTLELVWDFKVVKSIESGTSPLEFQPQFFHLLAINI